MAVNFGSLLGGIGQGLMSLSEQQRLQRSQDLTQAQQERQFQQGQRQNLLQFALQARQSDLALKASERAQRALEDKEAQGIYSEIARLSGLDQADDEATFKSLREYGLSEEDQKQRISERNARHETFRQQVEALAALPAVKSRYGNAAALIKPSRFTEGFRLPGPLVAGKDALDLIEKETKAIQAMPENAKAGAVGVARSRLKAMGVSQQTIDQAFPSYGSILPGQFGPTDTKQFLTPEGLKMIEKPSGIKSGGAFDAAVGPVLAAANNKYPTVGTPTTPITSTDILRSFATEQYGMTPEQFEALRTPGATDTSAVKESGRRASVSASPESGAKVSVEEPLRATYATPEATSYKNALMQENIRLMRGLYDPKIRQANAAADLTRMNAMLKGKEWEWFDKFRSAQISKLRRDTAAVSGAVSDAKAFVAEMAHNREMMRITQNQAITEMRLTQAEYGRLDKMKSDARKLRVLQQTANERAAEAKDQGAANANKAALDAAKEYGRQADEIDALVAAAESGNVESMGQSVGSGKYQPTSGLGENALSAVFANLMARSMQGQQQGIAGFTSGFSNPPVTQQPAAPSLNVDFGGLLSGVFGGSPPVNPPTASPATSAIRSDGTLDTSRLSQPQLKRLSEFQRTFPNLNNERFASLLDVPLSKSDRMLLEAENAARPKALTDWVQNVMASGGLFGNNAQLRSPRPPIVPSVGQRGTPAPAVGGRPRGSQ